MIIDAIQSVLTDDAALFAVLGLDENGFPKIYSSVTARPANQEPPWVNYQILPGPTPVGTYGNNQGIQTIVFQVTSWGKHSQEVWDIHEMVDYALRHGDWGTYLIPNALIRLSSEGTPGELPDQDTKWRQIPERWHLDLDRG